MQRLLERVEAVRSAAAEAAPDIVPGTGLVGVQLRDYQARAIAWMLEARRWAVVWPPAATHALQQEPRRHPRRRDGPGQDDHVCRRAGGRGGVPCAGAGAAVGAERLAEGAAGARAPAVPLP